MPTGLLLRAGHRVSCKSSHFRPVLRAGEAESHRRPRAEPGVTPDSEAQTRLATRGGDEARWAGQRPRGRRGGNVCVDYRGGKIQ